MNNVIELQNVTKVFDAALETKNVTAVDNLSFTVQEGGITGFVGPNGAGKTTSIKMILGLIKPSKGRVKLMGYDSFDINARKEVSFISEQPYFYEHLSAEETLQFIYRMKKLPKEKMKDEIQRVLEEVELLERAKSRVKKFSKGMQQRLNMAQALLGDPRFIIMDEPMSGLDPLGRRLFRSIFNKLKEQKKTIFFSTHVIEDMEHLCDSIVVLSKGKLHYQGTIESLVAKSAIGSEYIFEKASPSLIQKLQEAFLTIEIDKEKETITLQSHNSEDKERLLAITLEEKVMPFSISPIRKSLEDILYAKGEEANA